MTVNSILDRLAGQGRTLAVAESLTGGLLAAAFVDVSGASLVFRGGIVTYATETKVQVLGVEAGLVAQRGPVDPEVAASMAAHAASLFGADVAAATTGVAGPEPLAGAAVGTVFVAVADLANGISEVRGAQFSGDRSEIRAQTVELALQMISDTISAPG